MNKIKIQFEENKEKLKEYQDENLILSDKIRTIEEKLNTNKFTMQNNRNLLKEKEQENIKLKEELEKMQSYKEEKAKHDKIMHDIQNLVLVLKDENE